MNWFKRGIYKATLAIATMLLPLILIVCIPVSAATTHEGASEGTGSVTVTKQATPTEDVTVTVLNKKKLDQEIAQQQHTLENWFWNNAAIILSSFLSTLVVVIGALIGFWQWRVGRRDAQDKELKDRRDAQDKELKDRQNEREKRAEEHFQSTVMGLGDAKDGIRISAAILLRTFLRPEHEPFYIQIFDIAVANLRLPRIPHLSEDRNTPQSLTTLSQALVVVFKEVFPLARSQNKGSSPSLDAAQIQLDNAYLALTDLKNVWMPHAYLRQANLKGADLSQANLSGADLRGAILEGINLKGADLSQANLSGADLRGAILEGINLKGADLSQANLSGADLRGADLKGADLKGADLGNGAKLNDANLSKVILSRAKLNKARLDRANLEGANLDGANLFKANLEGANLKEASLCGAKLNGVNLSQAVLFRAKLKGVSLRGAKLNKAKLNGAVLVDAILEGAILVEADLSGTDLSQTKLNGSNLEGANLFKANLEGASLRGANLSGVHLESALLTNTNLHGVHGLTEEQLENCKAEGAIIDISSTVGSSPSLSQSSDIQAQSVTSAQGDISTPDADGSSAASSPQSPES